MSDMSYVQVDAEKHSQRSKTKRALSPVAEGNDSDSVSDDAENAGLGEQLISKRSKRESAHPCHREITPPDEPTSPSPPLAVVTTTRSPGRRSNESSQGSTESTPSDVSSGSGPQSSSSDDGKYKFTRQLSIDAAIKQKVSQWKAYNTASGGESSNIFDVLPLNRTHLSYKDFEAKLSSAMLCVCHYMGPNFKEHFENYIKQAQKVFFELDLHMKLSIPRASRRVHGLTKTYAMYPDVQIEELEEVDQSAWECRSADAVSRQLAFYTSALNNHLAESLKQNGQLEKYRGFTNYNLFPDTAFM